MMKVRITLEVEVSAEMVDYLKEEVSDSREVLDSLVRDKMMEDVGESDFVVAIAEEVLAERFI
jgi:hypothetical protein